jgi:hypothetical protein
LELADGRRCVRLHVKAAGVPTNSAGTDPRIPNAFAFPIAGGGFALFRFGDVKECQPWFTTRKGKTRCLVGVKDIGTAARLRLRLHEGAFVGTVAEMASIVPGMDASGIEDRPAELSKSDGQWIVSVTSRKKVRDADAS